MHIPPHLMLPQDKVDIVDLGPPEPGEPPFGDADNLAWQAKKQAWDKFVVDGKRPQILRMHIVDAKHAMQVEPERYVVAGLPAEKAEEPTPEAEEINEDSDRE